MANIITSKTRAWYQTKPVPGSQLNFGHPLAQGLVGCWLMNEGGGLRVQDIAKNHNGTKTTGSLFDWNQSSFGPILSQQGSDAGQNIVCGTRNDMLLYNQPCSIVALVQANSAGDNNQGCIIAKQTSGGASVSLHTGITDTFYFRVYGTTTLTARASNSSLPFSSTQPLRQIASTWDGSVTAANIHLYVSGKEMTYQTQTDGASLSNNSANQIGMFNYSSGGGAGLRGKIGYVYVYNLVLSPSKIQSLYVAPYQVVLPPKRRTFFVPVSGGGAVDVTVNLTAVKANLVAPSVTVSTVKNVTVNLSPCVASLKALAATVSTAGNVTVNVGTLKASLVVPAVTVTAVKNVTVNVGILKLSLKAPTVSVSAGGNITVNCGIAKASLIAPAVTVTTVRNVTVTIGSAKMSMALYSVTVSAGGAGTGAGDIMLYPSRIEKLILNNSRISKTLLEESEIDKTIVLESPLH